MSPPGGGAGGAGGQRGAGGGGGEGHSSGAVGGDGAPREWVDAKMRHVHAERPASIELKWTSSEVWTSQLFVWWPYSMAVQRLALLRHLALHALRLSAGGL